MKTFSHLDPTLTQAMAFESAPDTLKRTLLQGARFRDARDARIRKRSWFFSAAAAAAILLSGGAGGFLLYSRSQGGAAHTAREALRNYMEVHTLEFQGQNSCAEACLGWSKAKLGFECPLPSTCAESKVIGGRACKVDGLSVAHFLLEDGRALYVFREPLKGGALVPGAPLAVAGGFQAKAWNEQGRGYVMVEQPRGNHLFAPR
jgi:anti-sigma factor RsiW